MILLVILIFIFLLFSPWNEGFSKNKGVVMMYCTDDIAQKWAKYSIDINKKYANRNGYDFIVVKTPYDKSVTHAWQKIPAMSDLLNKGYEFVMYIDADAIFNDHNIKIETIFDKYKGDFLVCSDKANSNDEYAVNGGMIIVKNTPKVKDLLNKWWDLRHKYTTFAFEQKALSDIVRNKLNIDSSIITVCPESEFNSIYYEVLNYVNNFKTQEPPKRYVLHFMAMNDEKREEILSFLWKRTFS